jgi:hypothetical protein
MVSTVDVQHVTYQGPARVGWCTTTSCWSNFAYMTSTNNFSTALAEATTGTQGIGSLAYLVEGTGLEGTIDGCIVSLSSGNPKRSPSDPQQLVGVTLGGRP